MSFIINDQDPNLHDLVNMYRLPWQRRCTAILWHIHQMIVAPIKGYPHIPRIVDYNEIYNSNGSRVYNLEIHKPPSDKEIKALANNFCGYHNLGGLHKLKSIAFKVPNDEPCRFGDIIQFDKIIAKLFSVHSEDIYNPQECPAILYLLKFEFIIT